MSFLSGKSYFVSNSDTGTLTYQINLKIRVIPWSGNVRELKNVIERAMILSKSEQITVQHLLLHESPEAQLHEMYVDQIVAFLMSKTGIDIADLEYRFIQRAMDMSANNISKSARLLGLSRPTLRYRLEKLGIFNPS